MNDPLFGLALWPRQILGRARLHEGGIRSRTPSFIAAGILAAGLLFGSLPGCTEAPTEQRMQTSALFIGIDAGGSFRRSGSYDQALSFLAHYVYGHLNELGGLDKPHAMFIASIGGNTTREPNRFHSIHEFEGKSVSQIESALRHQFPPTDVGTDFNPFFHEVARISTERTLVRAPINVMILTDGVPDSPIGGSTAGAQELYAKIDLKPLESLSRNVTVRLAYITPKVGEQWRAQVPRNRVRLWTVDAEVLRGWTARLQPGVTLHEQSGFWRWLRDDVDYRIPSHT